MRNKTKSRENGLDVQKLEKDNALAQHLLASGIAPVLPHISLCPACDVDPVVTGVAFDDGVLSSKET
eukprot:1559581-Amphidinium_carterae.1